MEHDSILNLRGQLPASSAANAEMPAASTFLSVLYYSGLILVLPIAAFFTTKSVVLETFLGYDSDVTCNVISAVVAVVVLHVALGVFIYKAYFEGASSTAKKSLVGKQE